MQHFQQRDDTGFSLLELVVAVSIMLILGTVGTVSYQSYTENARQATVDSEADKVLTAVIASANAPDGDSTEAVKSYNASTDDIVANIIESTPERLVVEARDRSGTVGTATIAGSNLGIETTAFSDPGVTYAWAGEPHNSASIKYQDGKEVARNYAINPTYTTGLWWHSNNSNFATAERTVITDHPQGITHGMKSTMKERGHREGIGNSLSIFSLGGPHLDASNYYVGVWVKTDRPASAGFGLNNYTYDLPVNEWYFMVTDEPRSGTRPGLVINHGSNDIAAEATTYATGAIITYDAPPTQYFDGDSQ